MSDNYSDNKSLKLYEKEQNVKLIENHKCTTVSMPSSKVLQLVSIFENEESETKLKSLSQRRPAAVRAAEEPETAGRADGPDGAGASSERAAARSDGSPSSDDAVAVTDRSGDWIGQRDRDLLFVIHPWCMLHKPTADRQSEFPPPGFLDRLKAKLMALHHRQSDEQQCAGPAAAAVVCRRRRHNHQRIKRWFQYTATALGGGGGGGGPAAVATAVRGARPRNEPAAAAAVDFLSVWRRYANVAAACSAADRG